MLIANDSFAHWRYKTARRTAAIGRGKCLQRRLLDHEPLGGHLVGRRVHARVRDLAKPPRNCSIRRLLVGFQASLSHRRNKRNPEAALQIADEAFDLALRLRGADTADTVAAGILRAVHNRGTPHPSVAMKSDSLSAPRPTVAQS